MQAWREELAPLGAVQSVEGLGTGPQDSCTHQRFRVTFSSGSTVAVDLCMAASGAIDSIAISPQ
jgi:predicted secreted protein